MTRRSQKIIRFLMVGTIMLLPLQGLAAGAELALDLLDAKVSYTATYQATDGKGEYGGRVWHQFGRERRDVEIKGGTQAVLLRRDMDDAYLINATGKWYVAVNFQAALSLVGGLDGMKVSRKSMGADMVEGQSATRYHIIASREDGRQFVGDIWVLASGVPVKVEGSESEPGGKITDVELVQFNIKVGPVAPEQMEVPTGYMGVNLKKISPENLVKTIQSIAPLLAIKK
jgi:hypothetical protein